MTLTEQQLRDIARVCDWFDGCGVGLLTRGNIQALSRPAESVEVPRELIERIDRVIANCQRWFDNSDSDIVLLLKDCKAALTHSEETK